MARRKKKRSRQLSAPSPRQPALWPRRWKVPIVAAIAVTIVVLGWLVVSRPGVHSTTENPSPDGRIPAAASQPGAAAGFAPVTDLAALSEFRGKEQHALVKKLSLVNQANQLAGRSVWIVIGDQDQRVGTKHAIDLATRLTAASLKKQVPSRVRHSSSLQTNPNILPVPN